ncbi:hypothetical protein PC116_g13323 [Phytophthora cactorum]|uniref:BTB domain-containing protein n=1 Tax=Phytophthora cactorum TaxID=29920 RepID=A0A8T1AYA6_9STRA|nr:hypothetical protein PC115_g19203 [Phytophthora cactorum]KAG2894985.1 hypothetical protein PC114_g15680 [Phytophthora cactorum]KAG2925924.1 hypothetical protein PC117_g15064 [Phytophthora cactorum]KAG3000690.1 hypothetical protein PC120_g20638 [Phytophthora cactorum]KAG3055739.1 hypothetical protein PC121_g15622 [Phytophthora cactorum]
MDCTFLISNCGVVFHNNWGRYQTQESTISRSTIHELDVVWYPVHCGNGPSVLHGFVGGVYNNSLFVFEKRTPTSMVSCYKKLQLQHESIPAAPDSTVISERSSHCYLRSLVGNSTLSDITLIVEGIKIFGHKNLCARYTPFQDIFVEQAVHGQEIKISNMTQAIFLLLLEYVYCDRVDVASEAAVELFAAADRNFPKERVDITPTFEKLQRSENDDSSLTGNE